MSSGGLTIELPPALADDVRAAAEARGISPEEFVREQIAFDIAVSGIDLDEDTAEDEEIATEFDRSGIAVDGEEVMAWLQSIGTGNELPRPRARKLK